MTSLENNVVAPPAVRRSEAELLLDQLAGIEEWTRAHRATGRLFDTAMSREQRLDLARRRDVVDRQRAALLARTACQLQSSDRPRSGVAGRALIVHRNDWFKGKLCAGLEAGGITVVDQLANGAEAVGVAVAEQPDVVVLEGALPMLSGLDVTREVRRYAPRTVVIAQVGSDVEVGPFLESGATSAYTRSVPPADIAADVLALLMGSRQPG